MATLADFMPREIEILQLILAGRINQASVAQISISEKTGEIDRDHICTKIGVRTRVLGGMWVIQHPREVELRNFLAKVTN